MNSEEGCRPARGPAPAPLLPCGPAPAPPPAPYTGCSWTHRGLGSPASSQTLRSGSCCCRTWVRSGCSPQNKEGRGRNREAEGCSQWGQGQNPGAVSSGDPGLRVGRERTLGRSVVRGRWQHTDSRQGLLGPTSGWGRHTEVCWAGAQRPATGTVEAGRRTNRPRPSGRTPECKARLRTNRRHAHL